MTSPKGPNGSGSARRGSAGPTPQGVQVSELALLDDVQKVVVPFGDGRNWICPNCEARLSVVAEGQDRLHALFLGKPPKYAHLLNDIIRCTGDAGCGFIFSPRSEAIVLRR